MKILFHGIPVAFLILQISELLYYGNMDDSFFSKEENFIINIIFAISLAIVGYYYKISTGQTSKTQNSIFFASLVFILLSIAFGIFAYIVGK